MRCFCDKTFVCAVFQEMWELFDDICVGCLSSSLGHVRTWHLCRLFSRKYELSGHDMCVSWPPGFMSCICDVPKYLEWNLAMLCFRCIVCQYSLQKVFFLHGRAPWPGVYLKILYWHSSYFSLFSLLVIHFPVTCHLVVLSNAPAALWRRRREWKHQWCSRVYWMGSQLIAR